MQISKKGAWRLLYDGEYPSLFEEIQNKSYEIREVLKDDYRSRVYRIRLSTRDLVLKIPNEKNTKPWIKFLTWFRSGEAFKNIRGMNHLGELGIQTTQPIMAAEKRSIGMVVDSWLVYEYLDGESCLDKEDYFPLVVEKLKEMHSKKVLHGDSQIRNFMYRQGSIYPIDSNPKPVGVFGFSQAYEFAYLRKSTAGIEKYFGNINDSILYKLSITYDIYDRKLSRFRKKFKRFLKRLVGIKTI